MKIDILMKIDNDPMEKQFLRENSYWYKYLNRSSLYYHDFVNEMKEKYKLTSSDKINKFVNNINTIKAFLDVLK